MNKKYLIIKGSARENGYTNKLCGELMKDLGAENMQVFDTYKESFKPCNGCGYCLNNDHCVNRDLDSFYEKFESCDIIVILSPVYNGMFPAPLKGLIDRFQVYYNSFYRNNKKQPIEKKRSAYFIAASGRDDYDAFEYMKAQLKRAFTILNVELKGAHLHSFTDTKPDDGQDSDDFRRSLNND